MKKSVVTGLCLALALATLSACTSTGSTGASEEPQATEKAVVEETATESTEETTEENTEADGQSADAETTEEPTEPVQAEEDVIIRLNDTPFNLSSKDPSTLEEWETFRIYYTLVDANMDYSGHTLFRLDAVDTTGWTITCYPDTTQSCSFDIFFTDQEGQYTQVYYVVDGEYKGRVNFIPFFYNETRGTIVGMDLHAEYAEPADALCELYFNSDFGELQLVHVEDPSPYGL